MIAVQKPPAMFSPPAFRPAHARHPSAPVVVRPSHTPGMLNIAKPVQSAPRPQHSQAQARAPRASPKSKPQQRSPQPAQAQAVPVERTKALTSSPAKAEQPSTSPEKSTRGRRQHKQPKDAGRRLAPLRLLFSAHVLTLDDHLCGLQNVCIPLRCRRAATRTSTVSPARPDTLATEGGSCSSSSGLSSEARGFDLVDRPVHRRR